MNYNSVYCNQLIMYRAAEFIMFSNFLTVLLPTSKIINYLRTGIPYLIFAKVSD